jgi:hypothetical protein
VVVKLVVKVEHRQFEEMKWSSPFFLPTRTIIMMIIGCINRAEADLSILPEHNEESSRVGGRVCRR